MVAAKTQRPDSGLHGEPARPERIAASSQGDFMNAVDVLEQTWDSELRYTVLHYCNQRRASRI